MKRRPKLSASEAASHRVLRYVETAIERDGYSPTMREIGEALGIPLATVRFYLVKLQQAHLIEFEPYRARTIQVLKKGA